MARSVAQSRQLFVGMKYLTNQNSGLDSSSLSQLDLALTQTRSAHFSMFVMEHYKGCNVYLRFPTISEPTTVTPKPVRYRTSDADEMCITAYDTMLRIYSGALEPQGSPLASYFPTEYDPKVGTVAVTTVLDTAFENVPSSREDILIDLMDNADDIMTLYHQFTPALKYKFIGFINSHNFEFGEFTNLTSYFKIATSQSHKVQQNTRKLNAKRLQHLLAHPEAIKCECEQQMFQAFSGAKKSVSNALSDVGQTIANVRDFSSKMVDVPSGANKILARVDKVTQRVEYRADNLMKKADESSSEIGSKLSSLLEAAMPLANQCGQTYTFVQQLKQNCRDHSVAIGASLLCLFREKNYSTWVTHFISLTSMLGINKVILDKLISQVSSGFTQQSNTIKLLALASTFMGKYNPVNLVGMTSAFNTMKEIKAIEELSNLLTGVAEEWGLITSPATELANQIKTEVSTLLVELVELELLETTTPAKYLITKNADKVKDNYKKALDLEQRFIRSRVLGLEGTTVLAEVQKLVTQYKALNLKVQNIRKGEARRQEPFAVVLLGQPGIGKSKFATDLISRNGLLAKRFETRKLGDKPQWEDLQVPEWNVWNENVSDKMDYADGYCMQEIHATDDLFQSATDGDHQRYINYISPQKYITNQASLETKGMPYTSKLFVGSCNKFPRSSKTINDVGALQRRFTVVDCRQVGPMPTGTYDKTFAHLAFDVYNTGVDYVQGRVSRTMTVNELTDYILDGIQRKYKMFCEEMSWEYTFQSQFSNVKRVSHEEMLDRTETAVDGNCADWHASANGKCGDPNKAFHRIIYELPPVGVATALREVVKIDPSYYDPIKVMRDYENWFLQSGAAVSRFAAGNVYFSDFTAERIFVIYFTKGDDGEPVCYVYDQKYNYDHADPTRWEEFCERFTPSCLYSRDYVRWIEKQFWDKYAAASELFKIIINKFKSGWNKFKEWASTPLDSLQSILLTFASWIGSFDLQTALNFFLEVTFEVVFSWIVGYCIVSLYARVTNFCVGDRVCYTCEQSSSRAQEKLNGLKEDICKRLCSIGYVYTSHSEVCKQFTVIVDDMCKMVCVCEGDCSEDCSHRVEDQARTYTAFRGVCKQVYGCPPSILDSRFGFKYKFESEDEIEMICARCDNDQLCKVHKVFETVQYELCEFQGERQRVGVNLRRESGSSKTKQRKTTQILESGSSKTKQKKTTQFLESGSSKTKQKKTEQRFEDDENLEESGSSKTKQKKVEQHLEDDSDEFEEASPDELLPNGRRQRYIIPEGYNQEMACQYEMQTDPSAFNIALSLAGLIVPAHAQNGQCSSSLNGIGYKQYVFTPGHLYRNASSLYYIYTKVNNELTKIDLDLVHCDRSRDIACWKMRSPHVFPATLERHVASNQEISDFLPNALNCTMLNINRDTGKELIILRSCMSSHFMNEKILIKGSGIHEFSEVLMVKGITHPCMETRNGDCGSPVIMHNPKAQRKIIGFHILGSYKAAYSAVFSQEVMKSLLAHDVVFDQEACTFPRQRGLIETSTRFPTIDTHDLTLERDSNPFYTPRGDIEYTGRYIHRSVAAKDSSLEKHALYGTFPVTQIPAVLKSEEVEDPSALHLNSRGKPDILLTQLNKYSTVFEPVPGLEEDLADMVEQLIPYYTGVLHGEDLGKCTEEEVLSGVIERPDSNPLDMLTTAGEPFSRLGKVQGKKKNAFLTVKRHQQTGRKIWNLDPSTEHGKYLIDAIEDKEALAQHGYRTLSLWKNCLKDETRPIEKVAKGKTRLFTAAPFDTVFLARKYFGKFKEAWQAKRTALFHSVGINCKSPEWTELAMYLKSRGADFGDADYSSYDGNLRSDFMNAAGEIVIQTICRLTGNQRLPYDVIWNEFVETHHVSGNDIHLIKHGNPSGNPMTTVVNCIVNLLYHWWCYRKITGKCSFSTFTTEVGFTCFGDDVLYSTNEDVTGYTFDKIAEWMKVLQQDYTTAAKTTGHVERKTIEDIQFLKRRFVSYYGNTYWAPLDTDSIEQQFNYTNVGINDFKTIETQIKEAAIEAAIHGREYFTSFKKAIDTAILSNDSLRTCMTLVECYTDVRKIAEKRSFEQVS